MCMYVIINAPEGKMLLGLSKHSFAHFDSFDFSGVKNVEFHVDSFLHVHYKVKNSIFEGFCSAILKSINPIKKIHFHKWIH